jgi:glycosyltransferase involved in cell wall biosynthesis
VPHGRVVFITQQLDAAHPTLGAVVPMVRALAAEVDEVTVLALGSAPSELPDNCRVVTFGAPTQLARGRNFAAALRKELRPRPRAVIAHMSPIYAVLAAPLCRPRGVPLVLWFTHWRPSALLRLAVLSSTAVATAHPLSFPLRSRKVVGLGHAIDVDALTCRPAPVETRPVRALALGRTSRIKGLEVAIAAVRLARGRGANVELEIRGASENADEEAYRHRLLELAGDGVRVEGAVPWTELPHVFARTDLLVNATRSGSLDKSVLEACASCVPAVASSAGFADLLPDSLRFAPDDAEELAKRLVAFAALDSSERTALGHGLRRRVEEQHSVKTWAKRLLELADPA